MGSYRELKVYSDTAIKAIITLIKKNYHWMQSRWAGLLLRTCRPLQACWSILGGWPTYLEGEGVLPAA
jgi:hypothetical protein